MLVGRSGLSPVMVGRSAELDRLTGLLGSSRVPTVALVAGEAGIGKTRLIQELIARVADGTIVLAGQADPGTVGRPMELFLDSIDGAATDEDAALVAVVRDANRPSEERVRAAVDLVRRLTAGAVGLVVFEDLHWADSESVGVFERLAEPDGGRLLLVGTYRPDALSRRHPASELLPRLERRHTVAHIRLDRLLQPDVSVLLGAVYNEIPSFRLVEALHTRTGGNPFFLEELIATSGDHGDDLDSMPLPWTVAELVRAQVEELKPDERRIVTAASVLGRRVSFDLLATVTGTEEPELIQLLRSIVDRGLMVESDPDVFSFHHEIAREAIESGLLGRERRRLHEAAFEALHRADSRDHVALARHARGAGRYDDMVEESRLGAHESLALGSTYQAFQLAELGLTESEDDVDLLAVATRAAWLAGLLDDALEYGERWLELAKAADDVSEEAAALAMRMRIAWEHGDIEANTAFTEALIDVIDRLPTDESRAQAMAFVAQSYMLRDELDNTCEWADKAYALADDAGLPSVRVAAMVEKGSALLTGAETEAEGRQLLERAIAEAERIGEHVLAARGINNLVWDARQWADFNEVRLLIERMRRHAEAAGFDSLASAAKVETMAHLATIEGDLDEAIMLLDRSRSSDHGRGAWTKGRLLAIIRAGLAIEAGDLDGAARFTEEASPTTERTAMAIVGLELNLAARRGDAATARERLAELLELIRHEGHAQPDQAHDLISAALPVGITAAELRPLVDMAGTMKGDALPPDDPWIRLIHAQLDEADGKLEAAADGYIAAAEAFHRRQRILAGQRGTVHVGATRTLAALGRPSEAGVHAEAAAVDLRNWRGWRVAELRAVERRLGFGPEPSGPDTLTPREREVAALLAEGLTNSQVAERLYISPRTAAVHVSNILAKLAMSSRAEVAAWAVREGLSAN
ncbi:MAG: helix-turn-helix transcriptional regulator [Acidimicrobiales bacterium]